LSSEPPFDPDREHLDRLAAELARRAASTADSAGRDATHPAPAPTPLATRKKAGLWGALLVFAALVFKLKVPLLLALSKLKFLLGGLKFLQLGKVLTTGGTMVVTIWVYGMMFGLPFAIGFVLLIFVHEMGHAAAMKLHGLDFGAPVFIPFVGAMIAMKRLPPNVRIEAEVAIAGPVAGGLASAACWGIGVALESPLFVALAYSGFFLNLFNLLPVSPLDGERIAGAISKWIWVAGLAFGVLLAIRLANPLLWLIVLLGAVRAVQVFRGKGGEQPGYFEIRPAERLAIGVGYFVLAALLGFGTIALLPPTA
jgi:Zn-dependent protease